MNGYIKHSNNITATVKLKPISCNSSCKYTCIFKQFAVRNFRNEETTHAYINGSPFQFPNSVFVLVASQKERKIFSLYCSNIFN